MESNQFQVRSNCYSGSNRIFQTCRGNAPEQDNATKLRVNRADSAATAVKPRQNIFSGRRFRQSGHSFSEALVAMFLSVVVSTSAIGVMSDSMGSGTTIIRSTQLSNELRTSMQIISRDIRRAGYTANAMWCLANTLCLPNASINLPLGGSFDMPAAMTINDSKDCIMFELDRNHDGTVTNDERGAYRHKQVSGLGVIQIWMGGEAPNCNNSSSHWKALTDSNLVDITAFVVDDSDSYNEEVATDLLGNITSQRIQRVKLSITGQLVGNSSVDEHIEDTIDVRNDILL